MNTTYNQKGFSAVEAVIIIVVVGLLGFGGWYIWQANNKDSEKTTTTTDSQADSTKLTTKLTSYNQVFSLMLPDGWKFTNDTELDYAHAIGLENMTYSAGTPATIVNKMGHRGGGIASTSFMVQAGTTTDLENYFSASEEQGSFKTNGGLDGKKYLFTAGEDAETLTAGSKSYGYKFTNGDKTVVITYIKLPNDPDQLKTAEDAIKTFAFL